MVPLSAPVIEDTKKLRKMGSDPIPSHTLYHLYDIEAQRTNQRHNRPGRLSDQYTTT